MTRIGIMGYGNLGRGVIAAIEKNPDLVLAAVFTRRDPASLGLDARVRVLPAGQAHTLADEIDVMILCGGSATDLPVQTPQTAQYFNVIDSFDTHANIQTHYERVDDALRGSGHVGIVAVGWDPGLFSTARLYAASVLPGGKDYTFWGRGVSQGHSDALRRIPGVKNAVQYTVPVEDSLARVRAGETPVLPTRARHTRECYVVAEEGADLARIENDIKTYPNYFADYDTTVHFISEEELRSTHAGMPHGGVVLHTGQTGGGHTCTVEFGLRLGSNPEFTASVLVAYARAAHRLYEAGERGCRTPLDIAPALLSPESGETLRRTLL